jgi:hypothetical protein
MGAHAITPHKSMGTPSGNPRYFGVEILTEIVSWYHVANDNEIAIAKLRSQRACDCASMRALSPGL